MSNLYRLAEYRKRKGLVCFTKHELNLLLSVYSRRVISGDWKAYAIDHGQGFAQFAIFTNAHAQPLYRIVKAGRSARFSIFKGPRRLAQSEQLSATLAVFERDLRLVSP